MASNEDGSGTGVPASGNSTFTTMQEEDDAVEFFRQKKSMSQILAEKKRRADAKKKRTERSSKTASVERADPVVQDSKRRRVSRDDDQEKEDEFVRRSNRADSYRSPSPASPGGRGNRSKSKSAQAKQPQECPSTLSAKYSQITRRKSKSPTPQPADMQTLSDSDDDFPRPQQSQPSNNGIIDDEGPDDDDDDDDINIGIIGGQQQDKLIHVDKESESEDEFAYLVTIAREKAVKETESKRSAIAAGIKQAQQDLISVKIKERLEQYRRTGSLAKSASECSIPKKVIVTTSTQSVDPNVEILVTSMIEGTKPLMFIRKLSQRLREVRQSWCDRQDIELTESQKESIFLTWKGTKLFDSTTCQRMPGLRVNGEKVDTYGEGFEDGKLHMEAWTSETFQEFQRSKALSRPIYVEDEENEGEERESTPEPQAVEPKWKLVLRSRGVEDFKLVVKGQTRIAKIISSFQSERDIGEDKEISLWFDGDMLDPEGYVRDMEFEDFDVIEVQIK